MHVRMPVFAKFFMTKSKMSMEIGKLFLDGTIIIFQMVFFDLIHMQHIQSLIIHVKLVEFVFPF